MILDNDKQIVESALDDMPITDGSLSERGWVRIGSRSEFLGVCGNIYWAIWTRGSWTYPRIEKLEGHAGICLFKRYEHDFGLMMKCNRDLRERCEYDIR